MENEDFNCKSCDRKFDAYDNLRKHMCRTHGIKSEDFFVIYYLNGIKPTCKCGCKETTKFNGHGFSEYKIGHISRIKNNWGHNEKAINNSSETRRNQFKSGERHVWNDGLTKETDYRVANQGIASTKENNPERAIKISNSLKGVTKSEEHNRKNTKHWKEYWSDQKHRDEQRLRRTMYMKTSQRNTPSKLETSFKSVLTKLNIDFECQFDIEGLNYDFHILNTNVLIEVDGDFWHSNPLYYKEPIYEVQKHNFKHDLIKNDIAIRNNYTLLRFWETDINTNLKDVVKKLLEYI